MPDLVGYPFNLAFAFSRPVGAVVRDETGALGVAAVDQPRFDHDLDGNRLGLLIGPGRTFGQADRCAVIAGDWEIKGPATVLHEYAGDDDVVIRRAYYTAAVRAMVNSALGIAGHHRVIGAVAGYLKNRGGVVRFRERDWQLVEALGTGVEGEVLEDGSLVDRILVIA